MKKSDLLAKVSLFSTMDPKDLEGLAERCARVRYGAGDLVIKEGDKDRRLFVIVSGAVDVIKGLGMKSERLLRSLGPLSYFGEMSLIDDMVRSARVRASEETELLSLDHETFVEGIRENPRLALELRQGLGAHHKIHQRPLGSRVHPQVVPHLQGGGPGGFRTVLRPPGW
jgi:CRP-like cAMP-binding protein